MSEPNPSVQHTRPISRRAQSKRKRRLLRQPVFRLVLVAFALIAVVPVGIVGWHVYRVAWDYAWREIAEKHQLLAMNLAAPISIYVNEHRAFLAHLAAEVGGLGGHPDAERQQRRLLRSAFDHLEGFRSLTLLDPSGSVRDFASRTDAASGAPAQMATEPCFTRTRDTGEPALSDLKASPVNGEPTIIMSAPALGANGELEKVLLGELRMDRIEALRKQIRFGEKGHSAIVDRLGKVVAHPNPEWAREMRDLSHLPVVQKMMRGETGVTEFYSPLVDQVMVAGYTSVPGIGWGIMVPQPKAEVNAQVHRLLFSHYAWSVIGIVVAVFLAIPLARWITRPINLLAAAAERLAQGDLNDRMPKLPGFAPREVRQLAVALRRVVGRLQRSKVKVAKLNRSLQSQVTEQTQALRDANTRLEEIALTDELSGLPNRRHFERALRKAVARARRVGAVTALLYLDLDQFKVINDTCGHLAGDELLRQLVYLIRAGVRREDFIARIGGDEFGLLLVDCDLPRARSIAEQLRMSINGFRFRWEGHHFHVTASIGVVVIAEDCEGATDVLRLADSCCYQAKDMGRDHVYVYQQEDREIQRRRGETQWVRRLIEATSQGGLRLLAQGIHPIGRADATVGHEVLLRLVGSDGELVPPGAFLPAAERYSFMSAVDRWVVQTALRWMSFSGDRFPTSPRLYINLSAHSVGDERFADYVMEQIDVTQVDPTRLCFEVTESAAVLSLKHAVDVMNRMRRCGCHFALDDFGQGMSSFAYLKNLPVDVIKIDRSFVSRLHESPADTAMVRSIADIARAFELHTIAEGVESEATLRELRALGVDYAQGYHLSMPRPIEEFFEATHVTSMQLGGRG